MIRPDKHEKHEIENRKKIYSKTESYLFEDITKLQTFS